MIKAIFGAAAVIAVGAFTVTPVWALDNANPATGPGSAAMESSGYHGGPLYGYGLNSGTDHLLPGPQVAPAREPATTGSAPKAGRAIAPNGDCATQDSYGRMSITKC